MLNLEQLLETIDVDPFRASVAEGLRSLPKAQIAKGAESIDSIRDRCVERGAYDTSIALIDAELKLATKPNRRARLFQARAEILFARSYDIGGAIAAFDAGIAADPQLAQLAERRKEVASQQSNWTSIAEKLMEESKAATDSSLSGELLLAAAETIARFSGEKERAAKLMVEASEKMPLPLHCKAYLAKAKYDDKKQWTEWLLGIKDGANADEHRVWAGTQLLARALEDGEDATEYATFVLGLKPNLAIAVDYLAKKYEEEKNYSALVQLYRNSTKTSDLAKPDVWRRLGEIYWTHLGDLQTAAECFAKVLALAPADERAREFLAEHTDQAAEEKFLMARRALESALSEEDADGALGAAETASTIAETELLDLDKAINVWKALRRLQALERRAADELERLLTKAGRYNVLVEVYKLRVASLSEEEPQEAIGLLWKVANLYRDHLRLGVMVINTLNAIIKLDPHNREALEALAEQYDSLGRYNDLVHILMKMNELPGATKKERLQWLGRVASVWADKFGNYSRSASALERALELDPTDNEIIDQLLVIYERRRQWRSLVGLLATKASNASVEECGMIYLQLAEISLSKLLDANLASTWYNRVLELNRPDLNAEVLTQLAALYERTKKYWPLVEVLSRQVGGASSRDEKLQLLERLAAAWLDKLSVRERAADVCLQILEIDPTHRRATRILKAIYVEAKDVKRLEALYGEDDWEEKVDAILACADDSSDDETRADYYMRAARVQAQHETNKDKIARAYERVVTADSHNKEALDALVSIYTTSANWNRLMAICERRLTAEQNKDKKKEQYQHLIDIAREKIDASSVALSWSVKGYQEFPAETDFFDTALSLAQENEQWEEVEKLFKLRLENEPDNSGLWERRAKNAREKLHDVDLAKECYRGVLKADPKNKSAESQLEELVAEMANWPELVEVYRGQLDREKNDKEWASIAMRLGSIQESRLTNLDEAAATYEAIVKRVGAEHQTALRALIRVEDARGNWAGAGKAIALELNNPMSEEERIELMMRLAHISDRELGDKDEAARLMQEALVLDSTRSYIRNELTTLLLSGELSTAREAAAGNELLSFYESSSDSQLLAQVLEVVCKHAEGQKLTELRRKLLPIYFLKLEQPLKAYECGISLLETDLVSTDFRQEMWNIAKQADSAEDYAKQVENTLGEMLVENQATHRVAAHLAEVCDELGDEDRTIIMWEFVQALQPTSNIYFAPLQSLYRKREDWESLCKLFSLRVKLPIPHDEHVMLLKQRCHLLDSVIQDPQRASKAYLSLLSVTAGDQECYRALERIYRETGEDEKLDRLWEREIEQRWGEDQIIDVVFRRADFLKERGHVDKQLDVLSQALLTGQAAREVANRLEPHLDSEHRERAAALLEPLYREQQWHLPLAALLAKQAQASNDADEQARIWAEVALAREMGGSDVSEVSLAWLKAYKASPFRGASAERLLSMDSDPEVMASFLEAIKEKLASVEKQTGDRSELITQALAVGEVCGDTELLIALNQEIVTSDEDVTATESAYASLVNLLSDDPQALVKTLTSYADYTGDPSKQVSLLSRSAAIYSEELDNASESLRLWQRCKDILPQSPLAWDEIISLLKQSGDNEELARVYNERNAYAEPQEQLRNLVALAELQERELGLPSEAAETYLRAISIESSEILWEQRSRLLASLGNFDELVNCMRDFSDAAPHRRGELLLSRARILAAELAAYDEAAECCRELLTIDAGERAPAAKLLSDLVINDWTGHDDAILLEEHFDEIGEPKQKEAFLLKYAEASQDPTISADAYWRLSELREQVFADREGALDVALLAAKKRLGTSEEAHTISELKRIAGESHRGRLVSFYESHVGQIVDEDQRREALEACLQLSVKRSDATKATEFAAKLLELDPGHVTAVKVLEKSYEEAGDHEKLLFVLKQKLEQDATAMESRASTLLRAGLCAGAIGATEDAEAFLQEYFASGHYNSEASDVLEQIYRDNKQWFEAVEVLQKRSHEEGGGAVLYEIGRIYEVEIDDIESAVDAYALALEGSNKHEAALEALERLLEKSTVRGRVAELIEPIYVSRHDWIRLVRVREASLEEIDDPHDRQQAMLDMGRLHEDQLEDLETASRWYLDALKQEPESETAREQFERVSAVLERWNEQVEAYQNIAEVGSFGDDTLTRYYEAIANVLLYKLERPVDAVDYFEKAFEITRDSKYFDMAESGLSSNSKWVELCRLYEKYAEESSDESVRLEVWSKFARTNLNILDNKPEAIRGYLQVLEIDPESSEAEKSLEVIYRGSKDWTSLTDLIRSRMENAEGQEQVALGMKLAGLLCNEAALPAEGLSTYEGLVLDHQHEPALKAIEELAVNEKLREQVVGFLEPIYRQEDSWQKLVVVLDAKLSYLSDPQDKAILLKEIAELHRSRGGAPKLALKAISDAWQLNPDDIDTYEELWGTCKHYKSWLHFVKTVDAVGPAISDPEITRAALGRQAQVWEKGLGSIADATASWEKRLAEDAYDEEALSSLERLYETSDNYLAFSELLKKRLEQASDDGADVLLRLAPMYEEKLGNDKEAAECWSQLTELREGDVDVLDAVIRVNQRIGNETAVIDAQILRVDATADESQQQAMRKDLIGRLLGKKRTEEALEQVERYVLISPEDLSMLKVNAELYAKEKRWEDCIGIRDQITNLSSGNQKIESAFEVAELCAVELSDHFSAIERYKELLGTAVHDKAVAALVAYVEQGEPAAQEVLESYGQESTDKNVLKKLYKARLSTSTEDISETRLKLAKIQFSEDNHDDALDLLLESIADGYTNLEVLSLARECAETAGVEPKLCAALEARCSSAVDPEEVLTCAKLAANLAEHRLGDFARASKVLRTVLPNAEDSRVQLLESLDRLYTACGDSLGLSEVLAMRVEEAEESQQRADLLFRLADLHESKQDYESAVSAYVDVLDSDPASSAARDALERLMRTMESGRGEVIGVLESLYRDSGENERLVLALEAKASEAPTAVDRAEVYRELYGVLSEELSSPERALDSAGAWLACDPESEAAIEALLICTEQTNTWELTVARLTDLTKTAPSTTRLRFIETVADIQLTKMGDNASATKSFEQAIKLGSRDPLAIHRKLAELYRQQSEKTKQQQSLVYISKNTDDEDERGDVYTKLARLSEEIGNTNAAVQWWKQLLDLDSSEEVARNAIVDIWRSESKWAELVEFMQDHPPVDGTQQAKELVEIAKIREVQMNDLNSAVTAWSRASDEHPNPEQILPELERVLRQQGDWPGVIETIRRRCDFADGAQQVALLMDGSKVASEEMGDSDLALELLKQVLEASPDNADANAEMVRVMKSAERWNELADYYEELAAIHKSKGNLREEVIALTLCAEVLDSKLKNPDAAGDVLETILSKDENSVPALTGLARLYQNQENWDACSEVLKKALALRPQGKDAASLYVGLGNVTRAREEDLTVAFGYFEKALEFDSGSEEAIDAIISIGETTSNYQLVADMLARKVAIDPKSQGLQIELAKAYRLCGQAEKGIPPLEEVARLNPTNKEVVQELAQLYFAAKQFSKASPIYVGLLAEAKSARKMKDVSNYSLSLGEIYKAEGKQQEAQQLLEEAFRLNPTNFNTMKMLGELYRENQVWDKAQRVYRSLVLQTFDEKEAGFSKADVYYWLGEIHMQLGEKSKAKGMFFRARDLKPNDEKIAAAIDSLG